MANFLIAFPGEAMDIPAHEMDQVGRDAHAVVTAMKEAGVYRFAGGIDEDTAPVTVAADGSVAEGAYPVNARFSGGFCVVCVPIRDEAVEWARRLATACRCAQELWVFMDDPES